MFWRFPSHLMVPAINWINTESRLLQWSEKQNKPSPSTDWEGVNSHRPGLSGWAEKDHGGCSRPVTGVAISLPFKTTCFHVMTPEPFAPLKNLASGPLSWDYLVDGHKSFQWNSSLALKVKCHQPELVSTLCFVEFWSMNRLVLLLCPVDCWLSFFCTLWDMCVWLMKGYINKCMWHPHRE